MTTRSMALPVEPGARGFGFFLTRILSDREAFYAEVDAGQGLGTRLAQSALALIGFSALYGAVAATTFVGAEGATKSARTGGVSEGALATPAAVTPRTR